MNSPDAEHEWSGAEEDSPHQEIRYGEARLLEYEIMATVGKCHLVGVRLEVVPPKGRNLRNKRAVGHPCGCAVLFAGRPANPGRNYGP